MTNLIIISILTIWVVSIVAGLYSAARRKNKVSIRFLSVAVLCIIVALFVPKSDCGLEFAPVFIIFFLSSIFGSIALIKD